MEKNFGAAAVELTQGEYEKLESGLAKIPVYGNRMDADIAKLCSTLR